MSKRVTAQLGITMPIIGGAMYPCTNPELVAAVSEAGGIGVIQPLSFVYVYGYEFRQGIRRVKELTQKPFGLNLLIEKSSLKYENRMKGYLEIALEEGCRFFVTALGNPTWWVNQVRPYNGIVYHDVTELKWAQKALDSGVHGLICVNNRAGGHAGSQRPEELYQQLSGLGVPLVCAGGIGDENDFISALSLGYDAVQIGTRFIATTECRAHDDYKRAIVEASEEDIVLTNRVTGIPLSVIRTPYVEEVGTTVDPISRWLFRNPHTKQWMRMLYNLRGFFSMKKSAVNARSTKDYYQAGKSVRGIKEIESVGAIVQRFKDQYSICQK